MSNFFTSRYLINWELISMTFVPLSNEKMMILYLFCLNLHFRNHRSLLVIVAGLFNRQQNVVQWLTGHNFSTKWLNKEISLKIMCWKLKIPTITVHCCKLKSRYDLNFICIYLSSLCTKNGQSFESSVKSNNDTFHLLFQ